MSGRRGQLLLIAGLGIAMTLVVLAIVLNTVIFTQNLATREAVDTRSPVEFTNAVDQGIGGVMTLSNFWNASGYGELDSEFRKSVSTWAGNATRFSASKGMATDANLHDTTNGTRIVQPANATWTSASDSSAWTMATGINDTRRFHANVSRAGLVTDDGANLGSSNAFRINVSDVGGDVWSLYVYRNLSNPDQVDATAVTPSGTTTTCSAEESFVVLDATEATLNGSDCGFTFASGISGQYDITVEHGDSIGAKYTLVVDREQADLVDALPVTTYHGQATEESPFTAPAIYSAAMNVTVDRADVTYTRNFTVTPETVPGGETYHIASSASDRELVYVDGSGTLSSIDKWGTVTTYSASTPEAIGPKHADLDGDDALEIAFVDGLNNLNIVDSTDSSPSLVVGNVKHTNTVLAVGTWNGETGVSYVNTTDDSIYHVNTTTLATTQVLTGGSSTPANSVIAVTDYDGDGDTDIVYTDTSDALHYVDGGTSHPVGVTLAKTPGIGGGAGRDFVRDGSRRVPFVTSGQDVVLVDSSGSTETLVSGAAVETSVSGFDATGDERLEAVYVNESTGYISFVTLDGTTGDVTTGGAPITANQTVGVA